MDVSIRPARLGDAAEISALAKMLDLAQKSPEEATATGFLVSSFEHADYADLLARAEYFYVAEQNSQVVGFVVGYGKERVRDDEWLNKEIGVYFADFTVIKQVCVAPFVAGTGLGTALYERVLERNTTVPVVAAVVTKPYNRPSTALHHKMGFRPLVMMTPPDGIPRTVWVRQPQNMHILEEQLRLASDLYKHEDLLNWQKLNNFLYVTVGLVFMCSFALDRISNPFGHLVLGITGFLGILTSLSFFTTLTVGTFYMQERKNALAYLERSLVINRSSPVLFGQPGATNQTIAKLRRSPSIFVLRGLPLAAALGWVAVVLVAAIT